VPPVSEQPNPNPSNDAETSKVDRENIFLVPWFLLDQLERAQPDSPQVGVTPAHYSVQERAAAARAPPAPAQKYALRPTRVRGRKPTSAGTDSPSNPV
jgi:hypothetical protein